jgi:uroporphyrinogen decarboxylase
MWDRFLRACRREPVDVTPVWFMRQAGRYMEEYRALRKKHTLIELCKNPELATEVTLQPVKALGVDAAILFADILLILEPLGAPFEFAAGEGPVIHTPVRDKAGVDKLRLFAPEEGLGYVLAAIRMIRKELDGKTPLIGFAGAPFTLASYLIEGGGKSKDYAITKRLMYREPAVWHALMEKLSEMTRRYLHAQVEAGAQAVQLFDSWIGALSPADYVQFIQPHVKHILSSVEQTGVPVIHFGTGTAMLLELQKQAGGTVIGIDAKTPLDWARKLLGDGVAVQGNLDNLLLDAPRDLLAARVKDVLHRGGHRGHIFNLGHGILPETNPDAVKYVVDLVHSETAAKL